MGGYTLDHNLIYTLLYPSKEDFTLSGSDSFKQTGCLQCLYSRWLTGSFTSSCLVSASGLSQQRSTPLGPTSGPGGQVLY